MKPEVQVFGEHELLDRILKGGKIYSHCISIRNPDQEMPEYLPSAFEELIELKFYDVTGEDQLPVSFAVRRAPTEEDARRILQFFVHTKDRATGYTIHCWHGHSRSTAAALAILYLIHGKEEDAAQELVRIRPDPLPSPNLTLLAHFDGLLRSDLVTVGRQMQSAYIEDLRKTLIDIFAPLGDGIEELPVVDERGLLAKATRMKDGKPKNG